MLTTYFFFAKAQIKIRTSTTKAVSQIDRDGLGRKKRAGRVRGLQLRAQEVTHPGKYASSRLHSPWVVLTGWWEKNCFCGFHQSDSCVLSSAHLFSCLSADPPHRFLSHQDKKKGATNQPKKAGKEMEEEEMVWKKIHKRFGNSPLNSSIRFWGGGEAGGRRRMGGWRGCSWTRRITYGDV